LQTLTSVLPLDNLTYLDLSYNDWLTEFPSQVLKCTALRKLDISGCRNLVDGRLPGCLAELRSLEWLAADGCDIIAIGIASFIDKNLNN
jgi:Leucine-rich repeat (LRR) protein